MGLPCFQRTCLLELIKSSLLSVFTYAFIDKTPKTDYLHIWLADDTNNHCECENCRDTRPADFYLQLLNEIDDGLTEANLSTKIVFLLYMDLLWPPEIERLKHPERFVLMFAPHTRSYTTPLCNGERPKSGTTNPFIRNHLQMPKKTEDNIEYLRQWQKLFSGDSFIFEYHLCWDVNYDLSGYRAARILFKDMQDLHLLGLNGMMICQMQRIFLPNGLAMTAMAAALWNRNTDYDILLNQYFKDVYGEYADEMQHYLDILSDLLDARYLRRELPIKDESCVIKFKRIPDLVNHYLPLFKDAEMAAKTPVQRAVWKNMKLHGELCIRFSKVLVNRASGNFQEADACWNEMKDYINQIEPEIHPVFDVLYYMIIVGRALGYEDSPDYQG